MTETDIAELLIQMAHNDLVAQGAEPSHLNVALWLSRYAAGQLLTIEELQTARGFGRAKPVNDDPVNDD